MSGIRGIRFWNYGHYSSDNYGAHSLAFEDVNGVTYYFSYETLVAFRAKGRLVVIKNYWGTTTGKHLNWIDGGSKDTRVSEEEFKQLFTELVEKAA